MVKIQKELSVKKENKAERYKYRSAEDIYEKVKPLLDSELQITTELLQFDNIFVIKAIAKYKDFSSTAFCEVGRGSKIMSTEQAYGAATSYAVKYALGMLFLIDNNEDIDIDYRMQLFTLLSENGFSKEDMRNFREYFNDMSDSDLVRNFKKYLALWREK